jgi:hypothetical protein
MMRSDVAVLISEWIGGLQKAPRLRNDVEEGVVCRERPRRAEAFYMGLMATGIAALAG